MAWNEVKWIVDMALRAFNGFVSLQEELEAQTYNEAFVLENEWL